MGVFLRRRAGIASAECHLLRVDCAVPMVRLPLPPPQAQDKHVACQVRPSTLDLAVELFYKPGVS